MIWAPSLYLMTCAALLNGIGPVLDITIKSINSISSLFCTTALLLSLAIHLCPIYNQNLLSGTSFNGVLVPSHPD